MRLIRMLFFVLLAVALFLVAMANRGVVTVRLFPGQFDQYLGGTWSARMPLFLVILAALLAGMVLGLIWEWLREAHLRQESSRRANDLARLEREVGGLRRTHAAPRDEVLAILDAPAPASPVTAAPAAALPARRVVTTTTTMPLPR
ncbi:LapA family protein [Paracoccus luteus]|uniref:LapA family protein n=1 Tax=Paracoccus luteus TaxID=2508543 RepID=UPI00106F847D|nr:LapA family protein [Paracoccus luteus]